MAAPTRRLEAFGIVGLALGRTVRRGLRFPLDISPEVGYNVQAERLRAYGRS